MINTLLVAATLKAFEDILTEKSVPYSIRQDDESKFYADVWASASDEQKELAYRQAKPAADRIASKELYIFEASGDPLVMRLNYLKRTLEEDSFGELMLERPDKKWRFSISIKDNAEVLASMPVADRSLEKVKDETVGMFNEIDDFGDRIFGIPCSNDYFNDINEILLAFEPLKSDEWRGLMTDNHFLFEKLITPMLEAVGREIPRICRYHPEAPQKLIDYFYGRIDYYFIKPIDELKLTRIGCVNARGGLGRIPDSPNLAVPDVPFPSKLLDVRLATGKYGELSKDTLQLCFDGGWSVCVRIHVDEAHLENRNFIINVYLPVTPFGSYRDQVSWI